MKSNTMEAKYRKTVQINEMDYTITDIRPVLHGCTPVDYIYELEDRELWRPTEGQLDRLIAGEITLRQLEEDDNI